MIKPSTISLHVSDVSGQRRSQARGVPYDSTVGELIDSLLPRMKLSPRDGTGQPVSYHALLEREGRHLNRSEVVGETLRHDDSLVLQPEITAG
jgi:hypothetical protein